MLTRCPRCETTFRVTPEQLKARHGRVRCGHCQDVFNALDTLIDAVPSQAPPHAPPPPADEAAILESPPSAQPPPDIESEPEPPPVVEFNEAQETDASPPEPIAASNDESAAPTEAANHIEAAPVEESVEEALTETPLLEPLLHEEPRRRVWPWALGTAVAALALIVQAAVHYRTEIAVLYPAAKPLLNTACAPFGCEVELPRKPELIGIETSGLSPDANGKLALSAMLKNRAPFAQQFPHLELTLSDTGDQPLIRRVLLPADYLPAQTNLAAGFGAGSEIAVNLAIEAPGILAAGYQLYLFYP